MPNFILTYLGLFFARVEVMAAMNPVAPTPSPRLKLRHGIGISRTLLSCRDNPGFPAEYSGPNSLHSGGEVRETISLDFAGWSALVARSRSARRRPDVARIGVSGTVGADAFPNGEAFRLGTSVPNVNFSRVFIRQIIGLSADQETVEDGPLQLAGKRDISRVTLTLGRMSVKDIFDNNVYANDPRTQFMNWAFMANEAWDYPADSLGYMTGFAAELYQPDWAVRYGFFQMPRSSNGTALDMNILKAWGIVLELERRFASTAILAQFACWAF
jgi:high affinity Mn2+ porin